MKDQDQNKDQNKDPELTKNEGKIFNYIKGFSEKKGYPPSYSEIQKKFGFKAKSSVQQYVEQLTKKGYLNESPEKSRRLPLQLAEVRAIDDESEIVSIPLEGKVAAGRLTEAIQHREYIDVPRYFVKSNSEYFALKVKGDSMIEDCIMDGDTVIIKRQTNASNGQTVVALVNDEATIKKYYRRKEHIELVPANPNYDVIKVEPSAEFKILGILSSVIRQLEMV